MQHLQPNTTLQGGKYRIEQVLGQGGFGITYLAVQEMLGRKVAIKEFFFKDLCDRDVNTNQVTVGTQSSRDMVEQYLNKFIKEAQIISKLNHPNIVKIHDIFRENDTAYYVMEYLEGLSLSEIVKKRGAIPENTAISYIKQVADALGYIHRRKINHLDIKPSNIVIKEQDDSVVLIDFGVSKQYDASTDKGTTTTPVGISHGFSPIEQYRQEGVQSFSPQSDVYALAATLYTLLTGITPPEAIDVMDNGLPIEPLKQKSVSTSVIGAIENAMRSKKERTQSVEEFVSAIDRGNNIDASVTENEERTIVENTYAEYASQDNKVHVDSLPKKQKSRRWALYFGSLFVVIAVILGIYLFIKNAPTSGYDFNTKTFFKAVNSYDNFGEFSEDMIPVVKDKKYGFVNSDGKEIVPCVYDYASSFKNGLALVRKDKKYGYVDKKGEVVVPIIYDGAYSYDDNGWANVCKDSLWGFIDKFGNEVVPFTFYYGHDLYKNCSDSPGFDFKRWKSINEFIRNGCCWLESGIAKIYQNGLFGVIDKKGKHILQTWYFSVNLDNYDKEKLFVVEKLNGEGYFYFGLCADDNSFILKPIYDEIGKFSDGLVTVKKNGKYAYFNNQGKMILPFEYDVASEFSNGIACVKQNGKYLFINKEGKKEFSTDYSYASGFTDGLAVVKRGGKYGCINKDGKVVIPEEYDYISSFKDGYTCAKKNNKYGVINTQGKEVIPFEYDLPININLKEGLSSVVKNRKFGFVDNDGKLIIPCIYDYAQAFVNGLAEVKKGKRTGLIDKFGNSTFDFSTEKQKAIETIEQDYIVDPIEEIEEIVDTVNAPVQSQPSEPVKRLSDTNLFLIEVEKIYRKQSWFLTDMFGLDFIQRNIDEARAKIDQAGMKYDYIEYRESPYYRDEALKARKNFYDLCDRYGKNVNGGIIPKWK